MAAKYGETRMCNIPLMAIVERLRAINGSGLGFKFGSEIPNQTNGVTITMGHGVSMTSWGENITVTLNPVQPEGTTKVDILSQCALPTQVIDWGKNKKLVHKLFEYLGI